MILILNLSEFDFFSHEKKKREKKVSSMRGRGKGGRRGERRSRERSS